MKNIVTKKIIQSLMLFLIVFLVGNTQAQDISLNADKIYAIANAHQINDLEKCKEVLPDCEKLFELTLRKSSSDVKTKLIASSVFGTLYDIAFACNSDNKNVCEIVNASLVYNKDECAKINPSHFQLCIDIKSYNQTNCENVKDTFLKSACLKKLLPSCREDLVCLVSWAFLFREDAEKLKTTTVELQNFYSNLYAEDKKNFENSLKAIVEPSVPLQSVVRAPLFPPPSMIREFKVSNDSKKENTFQKNKLGFKPLAIVKKSFKPSFREILHPWTRGEGLTVADWDGDGYLDVFTVDSDNVLFFENIDGKEFRKHSIDLTSFGLEGYLSDISVADIDGVGIPAIIVQSFPSKVYVLRWIKEKSSFNVEKINLPNVSVSHSYIKFKSGLGIIFSGWDGISAVKSSKASDYIARVDNKKKWRFEKIPNSDVSTLGVSVVETSLKDTIVAISRDQGGGTAFYKVVDDGLVQIPDSKKNNYFSNSTAYLEKSNNQGIWISSGLGFYDEDIKEKRIKLLEPQNIEECKSLWSGSSREYCVLRYERPALSIWPSLCNMIKKPELMKICELQNEISGVRNIKLNNDQFNFTGQVFTNLQSPLFDEAASKLLAEMGQIWHISPLKSPSVAGFLMSEAHIYPKIVRKLWWMSLGDSKTEKIELTNSLGLSEKYDATHFSLGDFDRDGEADMVFKSGTDLVFLKGETGGYSGLENNLQSGHLSKTLIKIPSNVAKTSGKQ